MQTLNDEIKLNTTEKYNQNRERWKITTEYGLLEKWEKKRGGMGEGFTVRRLKCQRQT